MIIGMLAIIARGIRRCILISAVAVSTLLFQAYVFRRDSLIFCTFNFAYYRPGLRRLLLLATRIYGLGR